MCTHVACGGPCDQRTFSVYNVCVHRIGLCFFFVSITVSLLCACRIPCRSCNVLKELTPQFSFLCAKPPPRPPPRCAFTFFFFPSLLHIHTPARFLKRTRFFHKPVPNSSGVNYVLCAARVRYGMNVLIYESSVLPVHNQYRSQRTLD